MEEIFLAIEEQNLDEDEALSFISGWDKEKKKRTWSENKALKLAQKKDRRHFDGGKDSRSHRPVNRNKLSIEELKKITRCRRCDKIGHWVRRIPVETTRASPRPMGLSSLVSRLPLIGRPWALFSRSISWTEFSYAAISAREAINAGVDITLAGWDDCQQPRSFLTVPGGSGWLAIFIASSLICASLRLFFEW